MTLLLRLFCLLFFVSFSAHAQEYQYQMDGSFSLNISDITPPTVNFNISWNEVNGQIQGVYSDNYFVSSTEVTGSTLLQGKSFLVNFPIVTNGVRSIAMMAVGSGPGNVPVTVTLRDTFGNPASYHNVNAIITRPATAVDEDPVENCSVGFGDLTGYCGIYGGSINEVSDIYSRCRTIASTFTRLELATTLDVNLHLGYRDSLVGLPSHSLGSLPLSPITSEISITNRNCGPLPGTTFPGDGCQVLTLTGTFDEIIDTNQFSGTYVITDEVSNQSCTFNLTLEREVAY
jgi:hypothetical protein